MRKEIRVGDIVRYKPAYIQQQRRTPFEVIGIRYAPGDPRGNLCHLKCLFGTYVDMPWSEYASQLEHYTQEKSHD